ncbi:Na+/H+ antiporter NhaA [Desulforegula conservatrix]|uniref:Na+/H+ antiporter NhaA n=1 Tax=Desulforegula conservatrix TaxID=153026 RepID=UPI000411DFE9|nr:Na+/H+ antiporter NhaA [Desulforegula conservatrix]
MVKKTGKSFQDFFHNETSGGIILLFFTFLALLWANSPIAHTYDKLWHTYAGFQIGSFALSKSLLHWVNDGLMAIFFFVVGLEIKREIVTGELSSPKKAMLPIAAAIGGMIVPAVIYLSLNKGGVGQSGWGIPMATDIAFAIGILALLGNRVPLSVKIFLTALAIVDDLGAVLVIAAFYTKEIATPALGMAALFFIIMLILSVRDVRLSGPYIVLGILLWFAMLKSGVHATIAGVLTAITIPATPAVSQEQFKKMRRDIMQRLESGMRESAGDESGEEVQGVFRQVEYASKKFISPLQRLEHLLHPYVSFFIMPVFALANAGVNLKGVSIETLSRPVSTGIILGLVFGKQIGVTLFAWLAVKTGLAGLSDDMKWKHIYGASWLAGIGFTMSLFIASLAFGDGELIMISKIGILGASFISAIIGLLVLYFWGGKK